MSNSSAKTRFVLTGFSQALGIRTFAFEGIASDQTRTRFTVSADLALARRYDIRLQELPLLCSDILDRRGEGEENRTLTYTEEDMRIYATSRAAKRDSVEQKRKSIHGQQDTTSHPAGPVPPAY